MATFSIAVWAFIAGMVLVLAMTFAMMGITYVEKINIPKNRVGLLFVRGAFTALLFLAFTYTIGGYFLMGILSVEVPLLPHR